MVYEPQKYILSSYNGYLNKQGDGHIDKQEIAKYITMKPERYKQFVLEGIRFDVNPFKSLYAGFILGSTKFIKDKLVIIKDEAETKEFSYKKTILSSITIEQILDVIVKKYKVSLETLYKS